jgi:AraC-like DNA-binding protein
MQVKIDDSEFLLKKGEAVLIFPNQIHSLSSKKSKHSLCIFSPDLVKAFVKKTAETVPVCNKFTPEKYLLKAILKLTEASPHLEKKAALYSLCAAFDKTAEYRPKSTTGEAIIPQIFSFVESNLSASCTLGDLAESTGYEYSYLSKLFKKTVGISFNTYVNHCRLSRACYLLENTDLPVLACAMECGYSSLRSFNRNFKIHLQVTPSEFKKSIKKDV